MPFVQLVPREVVDRFIELCRKEDDGSFDLGKALGFHEAVSMLFPDSAGYMVMDKDCALAGEDRFTDCMPRIVIDLGDPPAAKEEP